MKDTFIFGRRNYVFMIAGLLLIATGYALMAGGGSDDPKVFNDAIFNTRRLVIAPILVLSGFGMELYAIMTRSQ
jgi:ABC-type dipeptide/oligopeptide/nickel transport system permease component